MNRPHYKRLWQEARHEAHMLRRELARYDVVPGWIVALCRLVRRVRRAVA
jgi:hypothetical protein